MAGEVAQEALLPPHAVFVQEFLIELVLYKPILIMHKRIQLSISFLQLAAILAVYIVSILLSVYCSREVPHGRIYHDQILLYLKECFQQSLQHQLALSVTSPTIVYSSNYSSPNIKSKQ